MKTVLLNVLLAVCLNAFSQDRTVGVRVLDVYEGTGLGLSMKQKFKGKMSIEGTLGIDGFEQTEGFFKADFNIVQRPIPIEGVDWYLGGGLQTWFSSKYFQIGPEAILGISYDFASLPLNLFFDGTFYAPILEAQKEGQVIQIGTGVRLFFK